MATSKPTKRVSGEKSKLDAFQNRLEYALALTDQYNEQFTAAESRIRDVDIAREVMGMTKQNILLQASQAMLSTANQQPQSVLHLLR